MKEIKGEGKGGKDTEPQSTTQPSLPRLIVSLSPQAAKECLQIPRFLSHVSSPLLHCGPSEACLRALNPGAQNAEKPHFSGLRAVMEHRRRLASLPKRYSWSMCATSPPPRLGKRLKLGFDFAWGSLPCSVPASLLAPL